MNPPYESYAEKFTKSFDSFFGEENWQTPNAHLMYSLYKFYKYFFNTFP